MSRLSPIRCTDFRYVDQLLVTYDLIGPTQKPNGRTPLHKRRSPFLPRLLMNH